MEFVRVNCNRCREVTEIFRSTFTSSEGKAEGDAIAMLASELCLTIDGKNVLCFGASESETLTGAIFFTMLIYESRTCVFMLAPVAVSTRHQGRGIGKRLIKYGLSAMQADGVEVVVTYGDPTFYAKVGFGSLSESHLMAPKELSMPFGWLGQSLTQAPIPILVGRPRCVGPFDDPRHW